MITIDQFVTREVHANIGGIIDQFIKRDPYFVENHEIFEKFDDEATANGGETEPQVIEALEFYIVSPWLAERLDDHGEAVDEVFGSHVWGRTTSGQSLSLDAVIIDVYEDLTTAD